ncbi:uncharacterized protein PGTG_21402 [Puccinia graminis f. sp. tritici CRL 75-36-700-3]|uniref:Uncharacterized protein n=1 Tax=Puccinia graminis f. sp. tritici (strain CRL 75-36-700-3 / race SCCL) TaxID=418459 RepID=H6QR80_PUCGT|nr:uncharacterized protein PGTG_21402 [Puccinia graminis f. sp. tritici CRL 75-36-700-3]EHS63062.1 hypothetical protein PGTG_21402 [Puccinia graminis f. sp. tritici CRL 75-36-700-3]
MAHRGWLFGWPALALAHHYPDYVSHGMGREPNNGEVVIDNANFGSNAIKVVSDGIDES